MDEGPKERIRPAGYPLHRIRLSTGYQLAINWLTSYQLGYPLRRIRDTFPMFRGARSRKETIRLEQTDKHHLLGIIRWEQMDGYHLLETIRWEQMDEWHRIGA